VFLSSANLERTGNPGKGTVEVPSDGNNSMCFSGPRRLALAPGAYDLSGLQRSIQELVEVSCFVLQG
jgi:hypothetical protein